MSDRAASSRSRLLPVVSLARRCKNAQRRAHDAAAVAFLPATFFFADAFLAALAGVCGGSAIITGASRRPSPIFLASSERARA